ncbi:MAG: acyl-CoA/acyl-ACP dehydrogenase [Actinobacteria bacterium]|nr:acyl-CoA/acyl-ACP dehydrogenase [Actinomycetota bacterium]
MADSIELDGSNLAAETRLLRESVRAWLDEHLPVERVRELDEARSVPVELWESLGELGVTGTLIPAEYGGADGDIRLDYAVIQELARRYASIAAGYMVVSMAGKCITETGNDAQRQALLPGLAAGRDLVSFGLTEPGTGTDMNGLRTSAKLVDGSWRISGQKLYITLAADARTILVLARTDEPADPARPSDGLSLIMTSTDQSGVEVRRLRMAGLRGAGTTEVFLDEAEAPEDAIVGERGQGFRALVGTLNHERILQAFMALGIAEAAWEEGRDYAIERHAFGRQIGAFQAVQHPLAESFVDLEGARLLAAKAADVEAAGRSSALEAAVAKHAAGETAVRATDRAMRVEAGFALTEESDLMRHHRDARDMVSGPISNEMARNLIAERCGLPRSY